MNFTFVDNEINELELDLDILSKDTNNYHSLLFQHKGVFKTRQNKFSNSTDCTKKFNEFIKLAKDKKSSLVLTPEYSCPWSTIENIVTENDFQPAPKKLWVLGAESITPEEIKAFRDKYSSEEIFIHFEQEVVDNAEKNFLDPICYIFQAKHSGVKKLFLLVQFKTQHMGVWSNPIERDNYIPGKQIFVLRNSVDSIYLFTNICSEAENFEVNANFKEMVGNRWDDHPYIIINLQLNPKQSHEVFKRYRKSIVKRNDKKDVITLNWGSGTTLDGGNQNFISNSNSSILLKSQDIDFDNEPFFIQNHKKGLYYLNRKANDHIFYLNQNVEVFEISNQKPSAGTVDPALFRRTGPEVKSIYEWMDNSYNLLGEVDDGLIEYLNELNFKSSVFQDKNISFIDKERLINLSSGKVHIKGDDRRWHKLNMLESFIQNDNEESGRLTFLFGENCKDKIRDYIKVIKDLKSKILTNGECFPEVLNNFKDNCEEVMFYSNGNFDYKFNLVSLDGMHKATVAYLGLNSFPESQRIYENLLDIFEKDDMSRSRVVVWFVDGEDEILNVSGPMPSINDDSLTSPKSITRS
jgi:hypothetical protein